MGPDRARTPDAFWASLERLGVRRSELLREARLPVNAGAPGAAITTEQLFALWHALETIGGSDFAHQLSLDMNSSALPPSMVTALHAKNLGEGISRVARFKALTAPEQFHIERTKSESSITTSWPYAKSQEPNALVDATFAFLVKLARTGTEIHVRPKRIELRRSESAKLEQWYECPIDWNCDEARLVFHIEDLDRPFALYNRELLEMVDTVLDGQLQSLNRPSNSTSAQVRWHLKRRLTAGRPEIVDIAQEMALSTRSLQRKLRDEGCSFQSLLTETRRQLAREYLHRHDFEVSEIACLLGYDDQGSFYRAFQKWENLTPSEWRAANPH